MIEFEEERQADRLKELRKREEENLIQSLAAQYGLPFIDLLPLPINPNAIGLIPEEDARRANVAAFNKVGKNLDVATLSPHREVTKKVLAALEKGGYHVSLYMTATRSLEKAWGKYRELSYATEVEAGALTISVASIKERMERIQILSDLEKLVAEALTFKQSFRISRVIETILAGALATEASDIHLEPEVKDVRLRLRIDGVLSDTLRIDLETYKLILSRLKLLSGLILNVTAEPQDGRFSIHVGATDIEIRTSTLPGAYGEAVVMRVLNPKTISVPIEALGLHKTLEKLLEHEIRKPTGMILTTGPTGSGKTTTLYAFLKKVHSPTVKIITIEDPIEYHLPGIVQTQVEPERGYTFAEGLRSALRQDPDIIMVGEIRDEETAGIAINASLTGHFVFSTLHTNTAAGTFPRLIDLNVNPKLITSAINIAMAQRLVRRLCPFSKKEMPIVGEDRIIIERILGGMKGKVTPKNTKTMWVATGCDRCHGSGYKGRVGIFEAIRSDEAIERVLQENPSEREIRRAAAPQRILSMAEDGILKVLEGASSLEELRRVLDLETAT